MKQASAGIKPFGPIYWAVLIEIQDRNWFAATNLMDNHPLFDWSVQRAIVAAVGQAGECPTAGIQTFNECSTEVQ